MDKNLWWGYQHTSGTLQVKRYLDHQIYKKQEKVHFVKL